MEKLFVILPVYLTGGGSKGSEVKVEHFSCSSVRFSRKLRWLTNLLWGGSSLLAFEHLWHGEIMPVFPFLTAARNAADMAKMLHEMSTVGVTMAAIVTGTWCCMLGAAHLLEHRSSEIAH